MLLADSCASFWGRSHSEKLSFRLPSSTSRWLSHEAGATCAYQGQTVSLLWQSKQARTASARVSALSHRGSTRAGGLVWAAVRHNLDGDEEDRHPDQQPAC